MVWSGGAQHSGTTVRMVLTTLTAIVFAVV